MSGKTQLSKINSKFWKTAHSISTNSISISLCSKLASKPFLCKIFFGTAGFVTWDWAYFSFNFFSCITHEKILRQNSNFGSLKWKYLFWTFFFTLCINEVKFKYFTGLSYNLHSLKITFTENISKVKLKSQWNLSS